MLMKWCGIALILYGGVLFAINNIRGASGTVAAQNVMPLVQVPPSSTPRVHPHEQARTPQRAMGSSGDVRIGPSIAPNVSGNLMVVNNSNYGAPILSFGTFTRFKARSQYPPAPYHEVITSAGYEEWFKDSREFVLRGFDDPERLCKTPVLLGTVPKQAHTLTITITPGDAKKCLRM